MRKRLKAAYNFTTWTEKGRVSLEVSVNKGAQMLAKVRIHFTCCNFITIWVSTSSTYLTIIACLPCHSLFFFFWCVWWWEPCQLGKYEFCDWIFGPNLVVFRSILILWGIVAHIKKMMQVVLPQWDCWLYIVEMNW